MSKYQRDITGINKSDGSITTVTVDVYDVLKAFGVTCPALQHLIKKALCAGIRGHKNTEEDLDNVLESARRAIELNAQDIQIVPNFGPGHSIKKNACDLSCSAQCAHTGTILEQIT